MILTSTDINKTSLESSMKLMSEKGNRVSVKFQQCSNMTPAKPTPRYASPIHQPSEKRCMMLIPEKNELKAGENYDIVIPRDTVVAEYGGHSKEELKQR